MQESRDLRLHKSEQSVQLRPSSCCVRVYNVANLSARVAKGREKVNKATWIAGQNDEIK